MSVSKVDVVVVVVYVGCVWRCGIVAVVSFAHSKRVSVAFSTSTGVVVLVRARLTQCTLFFTRIFRAVRCQQRRLGASFLELTQERAREFSVGRATRICESARACVCRCEIRWGVGGNMVPVEYEWQ